MIRYIIFTITYYVPAILQEQTGGNLWICSQP